MNDTATKQRVKVYTKEVEKCVDCPLSHTLWWVKFDCSLAKKEIDNIYEIPDWCPLNNNEENK